ncbi:MAG TPA: hypothetical protein VHE61_09090 [Opitutaceae bacterium]|nr:hypothetical protein [Opitutaceae bacterium]
MSDLAKAPGTSWPNPPSLHPAVTPPRGPGLGTHGLGRLRWFALWLMLISTGVAAPVSEPAVLVNPTLIAYAQAHGIACTGLDTPASAGPAVPGDTVAVLITLERRSARTQWLSEFRVAPTTAPELAAAKVMTLNLISRTTKRHYEYSLAPTLALDIRTVGPVRSGQKNPPEEKRARTLIGPDMLGIGLDTAAQAFLTAQSNPSKTTDPELERAALGFAPALMAFFQAVQNTPGLKDILWTVVDKPSVWSFVRTRGMLEAGLNAKQAAIVTPPDDHFCGQLVHRIDIDLVLNRKPALDCAFFVTTPRPPLLTTAGVVRIVAHPPTAPDTTLDVRLVATHLAPRGK